MENEKLSLFETARSSWTIQVTGPEMRRVMQTMISMNHRVPDPVIWVQKVGPATRRWWSNSFKLGVYFDAAGTESDPETPVAIPRSFLTAVNQLTDTYGTAEIFLNQAEEVLTAESGGEYVVVDETVAVDSPPPFDPLFIDEISSRSRWARVNVRADVIERMVDQYFTMARTVEDTDGPPSFINVLAEKNSLRWTSDWSRWGRARLSGYSVASTNKNAFDVSFFPSSLFGYLNGMPFEEEVVIGTVDPDVAAEKQWFAVIGLDWAAWCPVQNENWERWGGAIHSAFEEFGFEFEEKPDGCTTWETDALRTFALDDVRIGAHIVGGAAGPDCVRLRYSVMHSTNVTTGVMETVMNVNSYLINARLTINEDFMTILVDVDNPGENNSLEDGIKAMLCAIGYVSDVDELLPLFGENRPKDDIDREILELLDAEDDDESADDDESDGDGH